jgi:phage terminase large subunit
MDCRIDFSRVMNEHFKPCAHAKQRYLVLKGGAGSGKSHFFAQKILWRGLVEGGHRFVVIRKTTPAVRDSCWALLKDYANKWGMGAWYNDNTMRMRVGTSEIFCRGLDKAEKLKSIEGVTGFWLEEATELNWEDFRQVDLRLRGTPRGYFQIGLTFNPISRLSWVYNEFFLKPKDGDRARVDHSTYKMNAHLDAEYVQTLERLEEEDENYYRVYTLGEWGQLRAIVYDKYTVGEGGEFNFKEWDAVIGGVDWGYNNPSVFVLIGLRDMEPHYLGEIYKTHMTNTEFIDQVKTFYKDYGMAVNWIPIYADNEEDRIVEFQKAGFDMRAADKEVPVKNQIDFLKRHREHIDSKCVNLLAEQQAYKWKEDKRTGAVLDETVKFRDHAMDAKRYGVFSWYLENMGYFEKDKKKARVILGGKTSIGGMRYA